MAGRGLPGSQFGNRTDVRFTINLWVGVPEPAESDRGNDSQLQQRIGALTEDGDDRWWAVDSGTDVAALAQELRALLARDALPWLEARSDLDQLVLVAQQHPSEFPPYLLGGFALPLARAGFTELSAEIHQIARRTQT